MEDSMAFKKMEYNLGFALEDRLRISRGKNNILEVVTFIILAIK